MIKKYLNDDRIIKGLHLPMELDFIMQQPHKIYDYDDGFVLFVTIKNVVLASCGFIVNAIDVFNKCKNALNNFTKDNVEKIYAMVYDANMPSRVLLNALGFKFMQNYYSIPNIRLYTYEVK
jgi:hypothetical protein